MKRRLGVPFGSIACRSRSRCSCSWSSGRSSRSTPRSPRRGSSLTAALVDHHSVDLGPYQRRTRRRLRDATRAVCAPTRRPGSRSSRCPRTSIARLVGAAVADAAPRRREPRAVVADVLVGDAPARGVARAASTSRRAASHAGRTRSPSRCCSASARMLLPFGANLFGHDARGAPRVRRLAAREPRRPVAAPRPRSPDCCAGLRGRSSSTRRRSSRSCSAGYLAGARPPAGSSRSLAGGVTPMLVLAWYQWRAFGAPWRTPSAFYAGVLNGTSEGGYQIPSPHDLWWIFGGGRGPVGRRAARDRRPRRRGVARRRPAAGPVRDVVRRRARRSWSRTSCSCAGWSGTPLLVDPGPRYLIPALAVPRGPARGHVGPRARSSRVPAAVARRARSPPTGHVDVAARRRNTQLLTRTGTAWQHRVFGPTLWSMAFGRFGIVCIWHDRGRRRPSCARASDRVGRSRVAGRSIEQMFALRRCRRAATPDDRR